MNKIVLLACLGVSVIVTPLTSKAFSSAGIYVVQDQPENNKPVTISSAYYELPIKYISLVNDYLETKKIESPRLKLADTRDFRAGFIKERDPYRGYFMLQRAGDKSYTRMQVFVPKADNKKGFLAMETFDCKVNCESRFELFKKDSAGWVEATSELLPAFDFKYLSKKIKDKYKKEYTDADLFETYGYNNETTLKEALQFFISPDENKIYLREPHLEFNVYELAWDEEKGVFNLKKI